MLLLVLVEMVEMVELILSMLMVVMEDRDIVADMVVVAVHVPH